jgi:hypothetical protein
MGQAAPGSPLRAVMADTNHVFYTNTFFDANYTNGLLHALTNNPDMATAAQLMAATNGVATNALARSGSESVYRFYAQQPAPGSIAEVCPYPTAIAGTPNYGPNSGQTVFQEIATNQNFRFMQDGPVGYITIWVGVTNGMTGAYGQVWKQVNGTNFDLAGTSSPLWPLIPNSANTFAVTGLTNVAQMDFQGLLVTYSSATVQNLFGTNGAGQFGGTPTTNAGGGYYSYTLQGQTNVAWTLQTQSAISVPLLFYMGSPGATASGDSIVSGTPDTGSGADDQATAINPTMSMPYLVGQALGIRILNTGQSGDRWNPSLGTFQARYTNDLCGKGARVAIVSIGDNDIRDGATPAYVAGGWSNIVATCAASNMVVVFSELMPSGGFLTSSLAKESNMVAANYILDQFPTWFPNVLVAKTHDLMGVYWSGGTPGNRMLMNPKYTADGVLGAAK